MDETTLRVAFAAFVHDIDVLIKGDITLEDEPPRRRDKLDESPPGPAPGPVRARAVIRRMIEKHMLPAMLIGDSPEHTDALVDLAAGYLDPRTPMQWILATADELANGCCEGNPAQGRPYGANTAGDGNRVLLPIFERLLRDDSNGSGGTGPYEWSYPLEEVTPGSIFPIKAGKTEPEKGESRSGALKIYESFMGAAARLAHREESPSLWFEHFESVVMAATSLIPSPGHGGHVSDVPLFDHLRITSAFAVALYLYHRSLGALSTQSVGSIRDFDSQKFLVIGGDFYGIQNFIFNDSGEAGKNRSKILRGRSFAVSLFSELAADMLCRRIGIPSICVVLNAAGRFIIIAPNTEAAKDAAASVQATANEWFMKISYGEMAIGIDAIEATPRDFAAGNFALLWEKLSRAMDRRKYSKIDLDRFGGAIQTYLDDFDRDLTHPLCPFCGKRPSSSELEGCNLADDLKSTCRVCHDHILLGTKLVKERRIAITGIDARLGDRDSAKLVEPIFGKYQVSFTDEHLNKMAAEGRLLRYWDISMEASDTALKDVTIKFINGSVPKCTEESLRDERLEFGKKSPKKKKELTDRKTIGAPKTFEHIASMALKPAPDGKGYVGVEALGVLKADLDHMGVLMSCGIEQDLFTPARLLALSRQVNWYFALYLPHLLKTTPEFKDIYTVFAGGDDLFLIGPWNRIIELVAVLKRTFADYVCHNEKVHFSAGITLHKVHAPLDKLAHNAESALSKSKDEGRGRITLFGVTVKWEPFLELQEIKAKLFEWMESKLVNSAMLFRLKELAVMAEESKMVGKLTEVHMEHMQCLKWRALFHYMAARNIGKGIRSANQPERELKRTEMIDEFSRAAGWLDHYGAQLRIAFWDVIYSLRKGA